MEHRKHKHARQQRRELPPVASSVAHLLATDSPELSALQARLKELEKRNLALEQNLAAAARALENEKHFADNLPIAWMTVDTEGCIRNINLAGAKVLGRTASSLIDQFLTTILDSASAAACRQLAAETLHAGCPREEQLQLYLRDEHSSLQVRIRSFPDPVPERCRFVLGSITSVSQLHSGPFTSEEHFRLMADSAPVLIWITAPDGSHVWFNRMWLNTTGRQLEQETGSGWMAGIHPDDLASCAKTLAHALETREAYTMEYRLRSKDGGYRHVLASAAPRLAPNGEFLGYVGSGTDITERKKTEEALRHSRQMLRHLVSYQERVREDERKRIAREIHDDLGQNLLALRIDVSMLHKRTRGSHPRLNERVSAALEHIDATIKAVRAAINNLRPTVLDLGLNAAIEWQMQEFQRRSGIHSELVLEEDFLVDDRCATALFRILQESLNNVLRHAQASRVCIRLYRQSECLVMEVVDNGVGIYPDCRRKANSFGLIGIEERVHTLGGELAIDASAERGTKLRISIPLR